MPWTDPMDFADDTPLTYAQLRTFLTDNLNETEAAKATGEGVARYFVSTGLFSIAQRILVTASVSNLAVCDSERYDDLSSVSFAVGPITNEVETGEFAIVFLSANVLVSAGGTRAFMGYEVDGATNLQPDDAHALSFTGVNANDFAQFTIVDVCHLTPGINQFTAKYRVEGGGTATFDNRDITVLPF